MLRPVYAIGSEELGKFVLVRRSLMVVYSVWTIVPSNCLAVPTHTHASITAANMQIYAYMHHSRTHIFLTHITLAIAQQCTTLDACVRALSSRLCHRAGASAIQLEYRKIIYKYYPCVYQPCTHTRQRETRVAYISRTRRVPPTCATKHTTHTLAHTKSHHHRRCAHSRSPRTPPTSPPAPQKCVPISVRTLVRGFLLKIHW